MWQPTHVQVTVQRAADLITKGKENTNNCFVTIALGKTKYQTSVKKKATTSVEWHEECELPIPEQGNTAEIVLTVLHQNFVDEFLGRAVIPLNTLDTYVQPKNRWFPLQGKPGKAEKARGRLEARIGFIVKSGSLTDLSKKEKHRSSIGQLSHMAQSVGGSLLSIGSADKRKGIKKIAKSIGSKMHLKGKKKDDDSSSFGSVASLRRQSGLNEGKTRSRQTYDDADPGVVSDEDEDFMFDDLSHKSSGSSLNQSNSMPKMQEFEEKNGLSAPNKPPRLETKTDEWELKLNKNKTTSLKPNASSENLNRRSWESPKLSDRIEEEDLPLPTETSRSFQDTHLDEAMVNGIKTKTPEPAPKEKEKEKEKDNLFTKLKNLRKDKNNEEKHDKHERVIIGGESEMVSSVNNRISNELLQKYEGKTREDLILMLNDTQSDLEHNKKKLKDLEDYLDELLLRVMETTPKILQNPYVNCKLAHKKVM